MNTRIRSTFLTASFIGAALLAPQVARAETTHAMQVPTVSKVDVGKPGKVSVTVAGKNGWHVNEEAPISLKLIAPEGVTVEKKKLSRGDLAESTADKARFDVQVTCSEAGKKTVQAEARFVMCQESACKPVKEKITLALEAVAAKSGKKKRQ